MFEPQVRALQIYREAGIQLVKIQISSAVSADFSTRCPEARAQMRAQLAAFAEDRYLHQTVVQDAVGKTHFFEDLPQALAAATTPDIACRQVACAFSRAVVSGTLWPVGHNPG